MLSFRPLPYPRPTEDTPLMMNTDAQLLQSHDNMTKIKYTMNKNVANTIVHLALLSLAVSFLETVY